LNDTNKAVTILKNNKYVKTISTDDNIIMVTFIGKSEDEANLLKELIINDVFVISFKREQSNLESLFLKIIAKVNDD
jgi:ABC-2 type transport system ATP-binding protein